MSQQYLFGDSDSAARRLEVLARVYRESTLAFLGEAAAGEPRLITDLGCGPGFTTRLLAESFPRARVVGLDNSRHFLSLARSIAGERTVYDLHDVTKLPFPHGASDLIYGRFLLAHLREPASLVSAWATQLRAGGLLMLEEVEWIDARQNDFSKYLSIVCEMLRRQGTELYIGAALDRVEGSGFTRSRSAVLKYPVADRDAATMFAMNIVNWKGQAFVRENYSTDEINRLEGNLNELTRALAEESRITWGLRQIVYRKD